jgi:gamma-glutamylcyclotransferase (GGCT)/AIG2-like uncharacterized protein YtfP
MSYAKRIERKVKSMPKGKTFPFASAKIDDVSTDTLRQTLHRLEDKGLITIVKRGQFQVNKAESYSELLFVYGSLKKGFDNHDLLKQHAKRLGKAKTVRKFGMFEDTFGNYPYLTTDPLNQIYGELYEIKSKELMEKIDRFEGAPTYYQRQKIMVRSHHGVKKAYVYLQLQMPAPSNQKPLKIWEENTEYKVERLNDHLKTMIQA